MFVDGRVHHGKSRKLKDEETRSLLRKKGYRVLELYYGNYSDEKGSKFAGKILRYLVR